MGEDGMNKCPFCNADHKGPLKYCFSCDTWADVRHDDFLQWHRGEVCYETELAALKSKLKEMTKLRDEAWEDIYELKSLMREMVKGIIILKEFINSEDVRFQIRDLPTEMKGYGIFERLDKITNRPEVRKIREEE